MKNILTTTGIPLLVLGLLILTAGCASKPAPAAPAAPVPCIWGYNGVGSDLGPAVVANPLPVGPASVGIPFIAQAVTVSAPVNAHSLNLYITFSGTDQAVGAVYDTASAGGPGLVMAQSASPVTLTSGAWNNFPLTPNTNYVNYPNLTLLPDFTYWLAVLFPTATNSILTYTYYTPATPYDAFGQGIGSLFVATNVPWGPFPVNVESQPYGFVSIVPANLSLYLNTCQ